MYQANIDALIAGWNQGKMAEELVFYDTMEMMAQLGLGPDPSAGS